MRVKVEFSLRQPRIEQSEVFVGGVGKGRILWLLWRIILNSAHLSAATAKETTVSSLITTSY